MNVGTRGKLTVQVGGFKSDVCETTNIYVNFVTGKLVILTDFLPKVIDFFHDAMKENEKHDYILRFYGADIVWHFDAYIVELEFNDKKLEVIAKVGNIHQYEQVKESKATPPKPQGTWVEL